MRLVGGSPFFMPFCFCNRNLGLCFHNVGGAIGIDGCNFDIAIGSDLRDLYRCLTLSDFHLFGWRRFDHHKLFPNSNWEFTKWDRQDALGFFGCCAFVGVILLFFKGVLALGG